MIKLALTDMDNTLVPIGARGVSRHTRDAIHAAMDAGVLFGPSTGRDLVELFRLFRADKACFQSGILSNGKRVRAAGREVALTLIPNDALQAIADAIEGTGMFLVCYPAHSNLLNPAFAVNAPSEVVLHRYEALTKFVGGMVDRVPDMDFVAATIACPAGAEQMDEARRIVGEKVPELRIVSPIPGWFDIMPQGVSKADGLHKLLEATGIRPDEVVVFGDADNDLEILREVKYSVAVANALPAVKEAANYQIGSCADEGVADALLQIADAAKRGEMPAFLRG